MEYSKNKTTSGITLIALVVTIVVLLILAGVTINLVLGEDGIISKAQQAATAQRLAEYKDKIEIARATVALDKENYGYVPILKLKTELESLGMEVTGDENKLEVTVPGITEKIEITPTEDRNNVNVKYPDSLTGSGSTGETGGNQTVAIQSITLSDTTAKVVTNTSITITATVHPSNATESTLTWTSSDNTIATVNASGVVTLLQPGEVTITATANDASGKTASCKVTVWDSNKVAAVKSADGITVPVPVGFTSSSVSTATLVENTVAGGFVIYENTQTGDQAVTNDNYSGDTGAQATRNQFVWVPVVENKPMFATTTDSEGNTINVGQLYDFGSYNDITDTFEAKNPSEPINYSTSSYHEPDVVTDDGCTLSDLQTEFNDMKESVETYGGFYIGRYETGNISQTNPVVVKANDDIANQTWMQMYTISKNAVQNATAKSAGIESRMIWGCQWDATMNWFLSNSETEEYVTNSTGGNYSGTQGSTDVVLPTGYHSVNNIYDMGGNAWEWTLESYGTTSKIYRGGCFDNNVARVTVCHRADQRRIDLPGIGVCFRLTLCM